MQTQSPPKVDWLSISPRHMARVMELSNSLKITPREAFELMSEEAAESQADVTKPRLPLTPKKLTRKTA